MNSPRIEYPQETTAPLSALAASGLLLAGAGPVLAADDPQSGAPDAAPPAAAAPLAPADSPQSADAAQPTAPAAAPSALAAPRGVPSPVSIDLVGITDFRGHIDKVIDKSGKVTEPGAATLVCEAEKARTANPNTLFVSNGDNVGGSAYTSSILKDQPTIDVLNAMKLDVTSAGNHEFDQGIGDLAGRLIPEFDAPILSANVTGNAALTAEGDGDGTFVKDVAGVKVGFVGVVTEELPSLVSASAIQGLTIAKAVDTANACATELKSSGRADVVVLAHADAELNGGQFNGDVDAVFGGHTHLPFAQVLTSTAGTDIAVVQADHYGLLLGKVGLTLTQTDGTWSVTARTASIVDLTKSDCADAYGVAAIVAKAKTDVEAAGATVVATLGSDFRRGTNDGADYGANRSTESTSSPTPSRTGSRPASSRPPTTTSAS